MAISMLCSCHTSYTKTREIWPSASLPPSRGGVFDIDGGGVVHLWGGDKSEGVTDQRWRGGGGEKTRGLVMNETWTTVWSKTYFAPF